MPRLQASAVGHCISIIKVEAECSMILWVVGCIVPGEGKELNAFIWLFHGKLAATAVEAKVREQHGK